MTHPLLPFDACESTALSIEDMLSWGESILVRVQALAREIEASRPKALATAAHVHFFPRRLSTQELRLADEALDAWLDKVWDGIPVSQRVRPRGFCYSWVIHGRLFEKVF